MAMAARDEDMHRLTMSLEINLLSIIFQNKIEKKGEFGIASQK
jgi:hypothetical protein